MFRTSYSYAPVGDDGPNVQHPHLVVLHVFSQLRSALKVFRRMQWHMEPFYYEGRLR